MILRFAGLDDLPAMDRLEKECFDFPKFPIPVLVDFILADGAYTLLAFTEPPGHSSTVMGSIMFVVQNTEKGKVGRIASVSVLEEYRNQGLGRRLMTEAETIMEEAGAESVSLEVAVKNEAAISLYKSMGYAITGKLEHYYGLNEHAHRMEKQLPKNK